MALWLQYLVIGLAEPASGMSPILFTSRIKKSRVGEYAHPTLSYSYFQRLNVSPCAKPSRLVG